MGIRIKEMPRSERPYEKFLEYGVDSLSNGELLAIIIRTGTKKKSVLEIANSLLKLCDDGENLSDFLRLSFEDIIQIEGIGESKAIQLICVGELSKRLAISSAIDKLVFSDPISVANYFMPKMRYYKIEQSVLVCLDNKNRKISELVISKGTVNRTLISPREIFIEALKKEAVSVIVVHNHPSGDPTPSTSDIDATMKLNQAAAFIGISLLDHIIIGDNRYYSFKEKGRL